MGDAGLELNELARKNALVARQFSRYADRTAYVWRNGVQIGQAPMTINGSSPPEGVFVMLDGQELSDPRFPGVEMRPWSTLSLTGGNTSGNISHSGHVHQGTDVLHIRPRFFAPTSRPVRMPSRSV